MKRHISIFMFLLSAFAAVGLSAFANGSDSDVMRLTPVGYRLGEAGGVTAYDPSVVTVTPGDTSTVISNKPVKLKAILNRDYKVIRWQKFDDDPTVRPDADPIEEFGDGSETVSVEFNPNVAWMYVTVVVKYDPVRTVKAYVSSFGDGTVSVNPEKTSYLKGDVVTLTAQPAGGYDFVRWSDGNIDHRRTLKVDDDVDLKAYIEPKANRVTFSAGEEAVLGVTEKLVRFGCAYGELPVPVREGQVFVGWKDEFGTMITSESTSARAGDHALTAVWEIPPENYIVVFDANGGTGLQTRVEQDFEVGVSQKLRVNTFYYPGHVFVGWNQNASAEEKQYSDEQIVRDLAAGGASLTLFAVWRAEKVAYTVHFEKNADDATGTMTDQQFAGGEAKPLSGCTFRRTGWTFLGWSTDPKALEPAYQDREKVQDLTMEKGGKVVLYAVWTKNPVYYIEYKAMSGDKDSWKSETVEQGKEYKLVTNTVEQTGHNPSGWNNGGKTYANGVKLTAQDLAKMAGDGDTIVFVANMPPITYSVLYWKNDGTEVRYADPKKFYYDQAGLLISKTDFGKYIGYPTGYDLEGLFTEREWDGKTPLYKLESEVINLTAEADAVVDLYAIWKSKTPSVTTNTVTFLTNGVKYVEQKVENGKTAQKPTDPTRDGYAFKGWTNETYVAGFDFSTKITGDLTLYAAWKENPQPVVDDLKKALGFYAADPITVTADPADCWESSGDNTINLTKDCTITFTASETISVEVRAKGDEGAWLQYKVGKKTSYQYKSGGFENIVETIEQGKPLTIFKSSKEGEESVINSLKCIKGQQ